MADYPGRDLTEEEMYEVKTRERFQAIVQDTLRQAQELYAERNGVYKDNFRVVGKIMKALFPSRQPELRVPQDFNRWHIFELFIVKLTRYAANWHNGGHRDSLMDMIVYLGMLIELDEERNRLDPQENGPQDPSWERDKY